VVRRTRVQPSVLVSSIQHAPGHLLLRLDGSEGSVLEVVSVRFQHARRARHVTVRPRRRGEAWELRVPVKALMAVAGAPSAWTISSVQGDTIVPVRMRGLRSEAGVRRTWPWMPHVDGAAAYRVRPRLGLDGVVQVTVTRVEK
jgi:hypothetical protein